MGEYNKLIERKTNHCEVLQKINNNDYKIRLPNHLKTSDVFNVQHLTFYLNEEQKSRMNSLQHKGKDAAGLEITSNYEQSSVNLS
jgi:hypothetical protein